MEYVEEESRPRFLFQSRPISSSSSSSSSSSTLNKPTKLHVIISFSISILLLYLSFFFQSQTLTFLLVWTSLSLLLSPFAPASLTGGDPRIGLGHPLPSPPPPPVPSSDPPTRRIRSRIKPDANPMMVPARSQDPIRNEARSDPKVEEEEQKEEEGPKEWTDDDFEILKKQISKHPVGEPRRWEKVAVAFNGRHRLESVIKMGKSMGERRPEDKDSFAQFLKQRKPLDKRADTIDGVGREDASCKEKCWSSSEDIALLNALKAFPKDVSMRWEKVAAAVPGRSKGECVKRVSELKKDFRSSKALES